jgi:S-DNA-T family DNA segregation ATPase FtsK/SpoIIIE
MSLSLDDKQRRDLWGLALLALALLLALSLIPAGLLGSAGRFFRTGNVVGPGGVWVRDAAWGFLGGGAVGLPLLCGTWGAVAFGKLDARTALRWSLLAAGAMLLFPAAAFVLSPAAPGGVSPIVPAAGWLGTAFGMLLQGGMGTVGASLVLFFLFAALSVVTVGWNPLRTLVRGGRASARTAQALVAAVPSVADRISLPSLPSLPARRRGPAPDEGEDEDDAPASRAASPWEDDEELFYEEEGEDALRRGISPPPLARPAPLPPRGTVGADTAPALDPDATIPFPPRAQPVPLSPAVRDEAVPAYAGPFGGADGEPAPVAVAAPPAIPAAKPVARKAAPTDPVEAAMAEDPGDPSSDDRPSAALLAPPPVRDEARNRQALVGLGQVLVDKLATFKIEGQIVGMTTGPVVTQFEVEPAPGVKVAKIASLDADLALAMRAQSIRIVAPIPGKGAVGVEVPNPSPEMVFFREVIEAPGYRQSKAQLPLALGKDIAGRPYVADLARMPHLLIAGATGAGKSVCVNTIITSLVYRHSPRTLRFLMVDPKMVELSVYNDLPHLRHPVVTDNNDAATVLKWAVLEMERRYELLSVNGVRNLQDFNKRVESGAVMRSPQADGEEGDPDRWIYKGGALPFIVVIIDELADLMMTCQGDVEKPLALLAQKARAIGIHLILATQRPSVNVITGLIKANFPSRIAFRVSSKVDSRTILDQNGADNLLGNGDMLLLTPASSDCVRIQGAYLSTEETEQLMDWYREQARLRRERAIAEGRDPDADREGDILDEVRSKEEIPDEDGGDAEVGERDKLFRDAAEICIQNGGGSTSLLQRRLRIGYGRAARVLDQLHFAGVLGPPDGSKPRDVLVDYEGLDRICGGE